MKFATLPFVQLESFSDFHCTFCVHLSENLRCEFLSNMFGRSEILHCVDYESKLGYFVGVFLRVELPSFKVGF